MRGQICRLLRKIPLTPASPCSTTISPLLFSHLILPLISQCILPPNSKSSPQGSQMCWPYGYKAAICITTRTMWNNLIFTILLLFFPVEKITHISSSGLVLFKAVSSSLILPPPFRAGVQCMLIQIIPIHIHACITVLQLFYLSLQRLSSHVEGKCPGSKIPAGAAVTHF